MAKLKPATRNRLPNSVFGLPKQRKYRMEDRTHQVFPLLTSAFSRRTKKVRARCDQNLFAALKSANNITTRHSRAYSAFVLEGQQDAGAIFADLSLHQRSDAHTAGAA